MRSYPKTRRPTFVCPAEPLPNPRAAARAIATRWLVLHESGTFVKFTQAGADLSHDPIPIGGTGYR